MKIFRSKQSGFAMPALFVAVAVAFIGSLSVEGEDGTTVAEAMGLDTVKQTEFAANEPLPTLDPIWVDE